MNTGAKADCIYGATGSTKTSQLGWAAEYIKRSSGKRSRLISADPGGWEPIEPLVRDKTIEVFGLTPQRTFLIETIDKLCKGWWPANPDDPQSKLAPPEQSHWDEVGCVMVEGGTSICDLTMREYAKVEWDEKTQGIKALNVRTPDMPKESYIRSGDFVTRFWGKADYGGVQQSIAQLIANSGFLPVPRVIWTCLESKGKAQDGSMVYGPSFSGEKATGKCGPWFGNLLHLDFLPVEEEIANPAGGGVKLKMLKPKPFLFLRAHIDPADPFKIAFPAKVRAPKDAWQKVPDVMEPRLDKFYELLEKLSKESAAAKP